MRLGSLKNSDAKLHSPNEFKWSSGLVKILGILFHNDSDKMVDINYENMYDKINSLLQAWSKRNLSLIGKILIVNTLAVSQLVYKMMMVCSISNTHLEKIRGKIREYLWDSSTSKIAYVKLIQDYGDGGLKLVDLEAKNKSMKISWIDRLRVPGTYWSDVVSEFYPIECIYIWNCNISETDVIRLNIKDTFWSEVLQSLAEINYRTPENKAEVLDETIWVNSHIKREGKYLYSKLLREKGVHKISKKK